MVVSDFLRQITIKLIKLFSTFLFFYVQQFEHDTVLIPKETAWFGYYPDGAFKPVLPPQQVVFQMNLIFSCYLCCSSPSAPAILHLKMLKHFGLPIYPRLFAVQLLFQDKSMITKWNELLDKQNNVNTEIFGTKTDFFFTISWVRLRTWKKPSDYH